MKLLLITWVLGLGMSANAALNLYTDRPQNATNPIIAKFKADTGVDVNVIEMKSSDLLKTLKSAGAQGNPADVIFVKDMVYLADLENAGFFQPYQANIAQNVSANMKTKNWMAVTYRARTVVYNTVSVNPAEIKSYNDLADPTWAGRVCLRTSKSAYNQALVADLIATQGKAAAQQIVAGWVNNLAVEPLTDDTSVIRAVASGTCDVGIVNTYYLGRVLSTEPQLPVGVTFVQQDAKGTHVNGTGAGITISSKQPALANQLLQAMLDTEVQKAIVAGSFEFPANTTVQHPIQTILGWQSFKQSEQDWMNLGPLFQEAADLMNSVDYK